MSDARNATGANERLFPTAKFVLAQRSSLALELPALLSPPSSRGPSVGAFTFGGLFISFTMSVDPSRQSHSGAIRPTVCTSKLPAKNNVVTTLPLHCQSLWSFTFNQISVRNIHKVHITTQGLTTSRVLGGALMELQPKH